MRFGATAFWALIGVVLAAAGSAQAQDDSALLREGLFKRDRNVSVAERPHPDYAPFVLRAGAFHILPSVTATIEGDDNIYAATARQSADTRLRVQPQVSIASDWSRHALSLTADVRSDFYAVHRAENTTDYRLGLGGQIDVGRGLGLISGANYARNTEARAETATLTAINALAAQPVRYDEVSGHIGGLCVNGRYRFSGQLGVEDDAYQDAHTASGLRLYQGDRDHRTMSAALRAEYGFSPDFSAVAQLKLNQRRFRNPAPGEVLRSSSGYTLQVGANFDLSHLARGELMVGFLEQDYAASIYPRSSGLSVTGKVEWFPTQLTTVTFSGARAVEDAGIPGVAGYLSTRLSARIDHELLRNLVLNALAACEADDYRSYDRRDRRTQLQAGLRYLVNRAVTLSVAFNHLGQESSGARRIGPYAVNRLYGALAYAF